MNDEVIEVSEEIIPETAYTPIDYTEYLNKIIENQNSSLSEIQEFNRELSENLEVTLECLESLEEQNNVLIEQQSAMYELTPSDISWNQCM